MIDLIYIFYPAKLLGSCISDGNLAVDPFRFSLYLLSTNVTVWFLLPGL